MANHYVAFDTLTGMNYELSEAELAQVAGGIDGPPTSAGDGNG